MWCSVEESWLRLKTQQQIAEWSSRKVHLEFVHKQKYINNVRSIYWLTRANNNLRSPTTHQDLSNGAAAVPKLNASAVSHAEARTNTSKRKTYWSNERYILNLCTNGNVETFKIDVASLNAWPIIANISLWSSTDNHKLSFIYISISLI